MFQYQTPRQGSEGVQVVDMMSPGQNEFQQRFCRLFMPPPIGGWCLGDGPTVHGRESAAQVLLALVWLDHGPGSAARRGRFQPGHTAGEVLAASSQFQGGAHSHPGGGRRVTSPGGAWSSQMRGAVGGTEFA